MFNHEFSSKDIATNLKRIRKERKLSQKQLASLLGKSERTVQNYEAGDANFSVSMLKDIAIALDINWKELLGFTKESLNPIQGNIQEDKYKFDTLSDIFSILFHIQDIHEIDFSYNLSKPPENPDWEASISVNGKGTGKYNADICLFIENWMNKMNMLNTGRLSQESYNEWKTKTLVYYSECKVTYNNNTNEHNTENNTI